MRHHLLGTAAIAAMLSAAPALAQQSYYDTNPTPQERAQTDQLNGQALDSAKKEAVPPAPSPAVEEQRARTDARYDRTLERDAARRGAYERARDDYRDARFEGGSAWAGFADYDALRPIAYMPPDRLNDRMVRGRDGADVGRIARIEWFASGRANRALLVLGGGRVAWVDARDLRYDPVNDRLYTDLSRGEVDGMSQWRGS